MHRLKKATFLRTFSHDGIFCTACGGRNPCPPIFTLTNPFHSSYIAPSTPSPARLSRRSYLYSNQTPLFSLKASLNRDKPKL